MGGGEESDNPVEVNATAMIDVTLCLCAFFMCSFHFKQLEGKVEVWFPKESRMGIGCGMVFDDVRIFLKWDPEQRVTIRRIGNRGPVAGDANLVAILDQFRKDYERAGRPELPVVIDAAPDVPWQEVIHLVDLLKAEKLYVRFTERSHP